MADRLAKIYGTEEDKVNCPFYYKIGACRHGDTCTRFHNKPDISPTIVVYHLYENPPAAVAYADGINVPKDTLTEAARHFDDFYEEIYLEFAKYGEIEDLMVCDNIGDHMIGNTYIKYYNEDDAKRAKEGLSGRYYCNRVI